MVGFPATMHATAYALRCCVIVSTVALLLFLCVTDYSCLCRAIHNAHFNTSNQQVFEGSLVDPDVDVLCLFVKKGIKVIAKLCNNQVKELGESTLNWVENHVLAYLHATRIVAIAVGSGLATRVPASWKIFRAICPFGLDGFVEACASQSVSLLHNHEVLPFLDGCNMASTGTPLLVDPMVLEETTSLVLFNINYLDSVVRADNLNDQYIRPCDTIAVDGQIVSFFSAIASLLLKLQVVVIIEFCELFSRQEHANFSGTFCYIARQPQVKACKPGDLSNSLEPEFDLTIQLRRLKHKNKRLFPSRTLVQTLGQSELPSQQQYNSGEVSASSGTAVHSSYDKSWCVAKEFATPDALQAALDWACGFGGADCQAIQLGNPCFVPNTVYSHASYAFNSYYQIHQHAAGTCDFGGTATVAYEDPSYPGCSYPFRVGQVGAPIGGTSMKEPSQFTFLATSVFLLVVLL